MMSKKNWNKFHLPCTDKKFRKKKKPHLLHLKKKHKFSVKIVWIATYNSKKKIWSQRWFSIHINLYICAKESQIYCEKTSELFWLFSKLLLFPYKVYIDLENKMLFP